MSEIHRVMKLLLTELFNKASLYITLNVTSDGGKFIFLA